MSRSPRVYELLAETRKAVALRVRVVAAGDDPSEVDEALAGLYRDLGRALVDAVDVDEGVLADLFSSAPGGDGSGLVSPGESPSVDRWGLASPGSTPSGDGSGLVSPGFPFDPAGIALHLGVGALDGAQSGPLPPEQFTDELPEDDGDADAGWYSDDAEPRRTRGEPNHPLFDPGELLSLRSTEQDLDDSTPVIPPAREYSDVDEPSDYVVASVDAFVAQRDADLSSPFAQLAAADSTGREPPTWKHRLDELLRMLDLPGSFADADELAIEASRVQWATNDLAARLLGLPAEIQTGVVAMLAARAQHLRHRLDVDVGPRMSLDRLQRYRIDEDLPSVAALLPTPRPEHGAWEEDTRRWWALLWVKP
ncbi:MAG: hypothetical protein ABMB14_13285 [Myxococcota bacterium]